MPVRAAKRETQETGVVVLAYGASDGYQALLSDLTRDGWPMESVLVVRNPSGPAQPSLERHPSGARIIDTDRNLGYGGGMNVGIRRHLADGYRFIAMFTHDVRLRPGALERLVGAAEAAEQFGVLGPTLWWGRRDRVFSYGGIDRAPGALGHRRTRPRESEHGIAPCEWVDGSAWLVRAELLRDLGPVSERFFMYYEDSEYCLRARRAGWQSGVVLDAVAEQEPGGGSRPGAYGYLSTRNGLEYWRLKSGLRYLPAACLRSYRTSLGVPAPAGAGQAIRAGWVGNTLGLRDFLLRRWGPPPPDLPGTSDIGGT